MTFPGLQQTAVGQRVGVERDVALQQRDVLWLRDLELPSAIVGPEHIHRFGNARDVHVVLLIQLHWTGKADGLEVREYSVEVDHALPARHHFRGPRGARSSVGPRSATTPSGRSSSRTAALHPPEVFDREPMDELVRDVTRLD